MSPSGPGRSLRTEIIDDLEKFRALRSEWDALLETSAQDSVFLTWEWQFTWWAHFGGDRRLFILLARDESSRRLIAIAPWYLEAQPWLPGLALRKLAFLGTGRATSDFLNLIVAPEWEETFGECLRAFLQANARRWDLVEFQALREDSPTLGRLRSMAPPRTRVSDRLLDVCPYIPLPADYPLFFSGLGPKMRRNLKRDARAIEAENQMSYAYATDPELLARDIDRIFALHQERFRAKAAASAVGDAFSGPAMRNFHYDVAAHFLARGWLKLLFLERDGKPVAFLYAFQYRDRMFAYQSGFTCGWEKLGLVNGLFDRAIQDSIRAGLKEFHFLRGGESYKAKWTKSALGLRSLLWIRPGLKGVLYSAYLTARSKLRLVLERLGLRQAAAPPTFPATPSSLE